MFSEKDIDVLVGQTGASRAVAADALRQHGGDLVEALMALEATAAPPAAAAAADLDLASRAGSIASSPSSSSSSYSDMSADETLDLVDVLDPFEIEIAVERAHLRAPAAAAEER